MTGRRSLDRESWVASRDVL